ncbi:hypothetical protein GGS26DRAFT_590112 [Hypomontagnella submonticulosa]|nr:hypothetical protein GGS26DRAFT_590112 [Hypomontagnella submonticulosa]
MPSPNRYSGPDEPRSSNTIPPSLSPGNDPNTLQLNPENQSGTHRVGFSQDNLDSMRNLPTNAVGPANPDAPWLTLVSSSVDHVNLRGGGLDAVGAGKPPSVAGDVQPEKDESRQGTTGAGPGARRKGRQESIAGSSPEVVENKPSIIEYRARLAREMERREQAVRSPPSPTRNLSEKTRISPIKEESSATPSPTPDSDVPTASTESNKTVRGGMTPGFSARTPSYPFPRMGTPNFTSTYLQNVVNQQSQSGIVNATGAQFGSFVLHDQLRSDPSSPASAMTFLPSGASTKPTNLDFPTPNIYDLTLMLSAEPGLEAWWNSVVQIMTTFYKAERVTLSVPADPTDTENVPWGQKATYNALEEDDLSMGYFARGTSFVANSVGDQPEPMSSSEGLQRDDKTSRPAIQNRHSFTAYEDRKDIREIAIEQAAGPSSQRPVVVQRSKSYYPGVDKLGPASPHPALNRQALEQHDAIEEQQPVPTWEATLDPQREVKGRLLPVLQGLDFEADPLIDHNGITRVVERGRVIALTRTYPYLDPTTEEKPEPPKATKPAQSEDVRKLSRKPIRSESQTKLSSLLANASAPRSLSRNRKSLPTDKKVTSLFSSIDDIPPRPPTPKYEEYEQAPPSPWSQSPAPSPAVRADPSENPFFTDAVVDEESFNPGPSPQDYASAQPPETIGVDNSWTVLHVPLNHILLSKPPQKFKLDPSALEQKASQRSHTEPGVNSSMLHERLSTEELAKKNKNLPIAILSILTPIIPYPSNLRHSLEHLSPHLAATFSLCRHYSNLETEVMGLHRKRPSTSGFGAIGPDGRPVTDPVMLGHLNATSPGDVSQRSVTGSLTSPSEYSGPSRSINASPSGTPLWDSSSFGLVVERRTAGSSPGQPGGDSYFSSVHRGGGMSTEMPAQGVLSQRASRAVHKESGLVIGKQVKRSGSLLYHQQDLSSTAKDAEGSDIIIRNTSTSDEAVINQVLKQRPASKDSADTNAGAEGQQSRQEVEDGRKRLSGQSIPPGHKHTMLHSYGGDFSASFQSLPPSTSLFTKPTSQTINPVRPGSASTSAPHVTMLPPSDRLKGLMLDLLPVHVFVALPVQGEIVWVNSRYLTYRGQTLPDLVADPWGSLHPEDRDEYMRAWTHSLRSGDQFAQSVRLRRFDGAYRWHQARAVASRDKRGVIVQFIGSYMDIHDQKVAELMALRQEEIEVSEAKHRLLANLIPQIIFTATEDDGITFANEQWLSYTGQSEEDALGLGFIDFVHPDDLAKCRLPVSNENKTSTSSTQDPTAAGRESAARDAPEIHSERLSHNSWFGSPRAFVTADMNELFRKGILKVARDSNGRLSYTTEVRLRSKPGEYRWHLIRCVEIDDVGFGNGTTSYFGSATDINDHKLLEAKLKEAMESKGRFLSNMSHEIRTPLIGISGMVSFLQDTTLNEEQRDYTNTIQTSANSLLMIINDILDLSKVDAGMMKLSFEWFHTRSLIEDVNELVSTMAIAKRLELNYIVEESVPSWVKGDKVRIRQVLLNVIGNAIKFTTVGEVFSRCRVYSADTAELGEHQIMLEFSVIDTGRGFTKEEAYLIFKPFSQIDGSSTRQHGGSGLGLVISRQLVELHGGKMEGSAVPGKGSTFTFTARFGLPSPEDHPNLANTPPMTASIQSPAEGKGMNSIKPLLLHKATGSAAIASPSPDAEIISPAPESSGSSDPSVHSIHTHNTARSSASSTLSGLTRFSEAAKASGQDLSQMKLEMPFGKMSPYAVPTPTPDGSKFPAGLAQFRPPMYSILVICPQNYSREATTKHIEMTLPKDVPHQITAMASVGETEEVIGGDESVTFTHIVLNLPSAEEIIGVIDKIIASSGGKTSVLVLTDSVQRQAVLKLASDAEHQQLLAEKRIIFVYKPVKPSRFAAIFDPGRERDLSVDLNRSRAAQMVEHQKQNYLDVEKRIGNKGYKVLLVEDNPVNQKVLVRYLKKVGIEAEIAADGVECTEKVFAHPADHYALILCDLHMPRKDGYQACREIREWERQCNYRSLPIIALSANVMSDVQEKCAAAGFSDYVTKPVDFVDLSTAMSKFI